MTFTTTVPRYTIESIRREACELVTAGKIGRNQPIYTLCQHIPAREWNSVECELEEYGHLLRDRIVDLLGSDFWRCD
ncbi:MAG: DUF4327 family protein [Geitlerinemataceae cyanobacterium]